MSMQQGTKRRKRCNSCTNLQYKHIELLHVISTYMYSYMYMCVQRNNYFSRGS